MKRAYFGIFEFHPIHLDNVQCTGSEENITQCSYITSTAINCDHSEDAGVICGGDCMQFTVEFTVFVITDRGRLCKLWAYSPFPSLPA